MNPKQYERNSSNKAVHNKQLYDDLVRPHDMML